MCCHCFVYFHYASFWWNVRHRNTIDRQKIAVPPTAESCAADSRDSACIAGVLQAAGEQVLPSLVLCPAQDHSGPAPLHLGGAAVDSHPLLCCGLLQRRWQVLDCIPLSVLCSVMSSKLITQKFTQSGCFVRSCHCSAVDGMHSGAGSSMLHQSLWNSPDLAPFLLVYRLLSFW